MASEARALTEKKKKSVKTPQHAAEEMLITTLLSGHQVERNERTDLVNPMDLITLVRVGVPGNSIKSVAEKFDIALTEMYGLLHILPRTAQRLMKSEKLDTDISDRIVQLMKIHDKCIKVFQSREKMIRWLKTPNYALGDRTPLSLLDTTDGIALVTNSLTKIEYGIFG